MKIDMTKGSFYVNLPSKLYVKITDLAVKREDIDLGLLGLILHFILKNKFNNKNLESGSEWVSLCSKILRQYDHDQYITSKHLDFLIEQNVLESLPHMANIKGKADKCRRFKISDEYFSDNENGKFEFKEFE